MLKSLEPCDLMSIQEVAGRLDISERTIYKYVKEERIKAVKIGRKWRIPVAAYLAFVYGNAAEDMKKTIAFLNDVDEEMNILRRNS